MTPLSRDPERKAAQLANLPNLRGEPTSASWKPGATPHLKAGLRSRRPGRLILEPLYDELVQALEASVPLRDGAGNVLPNFHVAIEAAAVLLLQVRRCQSFLELRGTEDEHGRYRPENEGLERATGRLLAALDKLGATPTSYARLGFDVARGQSIVEQMAADHERERSERDA